MKDVYANMGSLTPEMLDKKAIYIESLRFFVCFFNLKDESPGVSIVELIPFSTV